MMSQTTYYIYSYADIARLLKVSSIFTCIFGKNYAIYLYVASKFHAFTSTHEVMYPACMLVMLLELTTQCHCSYHC